MHTVPSNVYRASAVPPYTRAMQHKSDLMRLLARTLANSNTQSLAALAVL